MLDLRVAALSAVVLAAIVSAGCRTSVPPPFATVVVDDPFEVAPAGPLSAQAPGSDRRQQSDIAFPAEWVNTWVPFENWGKLNGLQPARLAGVNPHPTYELQTTNGPLAIKIGSRAAQFDGLNWWLGFAPQMIRGAPCLHWLDAKNNLQPLLAVPNANFAANRTIVIDPGHGGTDSGARSVFNGAFEKDYTLDWAIRLSWLLASNGFNVILTRDRDIEVSLQQRVAMAERANASVFISLHFNSGASNRELSGIETYCLTPSGMPSSLVREYEDDVTQVFPNNAFDEQNLHLALRLHRSLVQNTSAVDRGIRRARFMGVLRGQNRPAVLIEGGYLSNPQEARRLADESYRGRLAGAVAAALMPVAMQ